MEKENTRKTAPAGKADLNDRIRAILRYLLKHNDRHAEQMEAIVPYLPEDLREKMQRGIGTFEGATACFADVLERMNELEFESGQEKAGTAAPAAERPVQKAGEHGHHHVHDPKEKRRQISRLARVIGHLEYVKRMLEADEDCSDVLIQISASKSALNGLGKQIIKEHISHCITHAVEEGDTSALEEFEKAIEKYI